MPVKVLIADSNRMACELLSNALQQSANYVVVSCAVTVSQVIAASQSSEPEVAVLNTDLQDGRLSGFKALREISGLLPTVRTVMLVETLSPDLVVDAFRAGAKGLFRRSESINTLYRCIDAVHSGQIWANSVEMQYILEALAKAVPLRLVNVNGHKLLSDREEQVVSLVAEGMTNKEISIKLKLSEHTVKNYLFRIFDKLGISSRVELILYALSGRETRSSPEPDRPQAA
jgi:DNA-binding NarL/FixJ family response regulator